MWCRIFLNGIISFCVLAYIKFQHDRKREITDGRDRVKEAWMEYKTLNRVSDPELIFQQCLELVK